MLAGVDCVLRALDAAPAPVDFFIRDDDAGWNDVRLFALLDCCARAAVPIDLAVIPHACSAVLARELRARIDDAPAHVGVHQHGYRHANHEAVGRKCEFGASRALHDQRRDLCAGRERLQQWFGLRLDDFFTPPWNRCGEATPPLLAALGYTALSRDSTAPAQCALPELAIDFDWCKARRLAQERGEDFVGRITGEITHLIGCKTRVGLMLHHAVMDAADLDLLQSLMRALSAHPRARWCAMGQILGEPASAMTTEVI